MQKIKKLNCKVTTKILAAGLYLAAVLIPWEVSAQFSFNEEVKPTGVSGDIFKIFELVANIMLAVIGAVAVVMLIVGGFRYVVSAGDSSAVESAKHTVLYAIIGIVVAFLAYAAIKFLMDELETPIDEE